MISFVKGLTIIPCLNNQWISLWSLVYFLNIKTQGIDLPLWNSYFLLINVHMIGYQIGFLDNRICTVKFWTLVQEIMKTKLVFVVLFLIWTTCEIQVKGAVFSDISSLYQDLFANYSSDLRPQADLSQPIKIGIKLYLFSINNLLWWDFWYSLCCGWNFNAVERLSPWVDT